MAYALGFPGSKASWGAAAPIIGSVIGTAADIWSTNKSNQANAANVDKQIAFQREQSETQYQRAVEDMRKAGLNPALAYEQGGNASASGAAATAQPIAQNTATKLSTAADAYTAFANGVAQRDLMREQTNATAAQGLLTRTQAATLSPEAILSQDENYRHQYFRTGLAKKAAEEFTAAKTPERFRADLSAIGAGTAQSQAAAAEARTRTTLNEQNFQNEWFRKNVSPYLQSTSALIRALYGGK